MTHLYRRALSKLPGLAPGDLDLAAAMELNVKPAAHAHLYTANQLQVDDLLTIRAKKTIKNDAVKLWRRRLQGPDST